MGESRGGDFCNVGTGEEEGTLNVVSALNIYRGFILMTEPMYEVL